MKMKEDENISQYANRIKASVSAIWEVGEIIEDATIVSKVLRTLLPIYAIRVSAIQEMRCDPTKVITLDSLVGRLTTFELDNFDNYVPNSSNIEFAFNAKLSLGKKGKKKIKQEESEEESSEEDLEIFEAYLSRKFRKGKGKYKGKIPLICFSCDEVGHIVARCP